jgi:hypothetical protein
MPGRKRFRMSPAAATSDARKRRADLLRLHAQWPETGRAFRIWLDYSEGREFLFGVEDLRAIARLSPLAIFADGTICSIERKEPVR